jgi:Zn-dependent protease
MESHTSFGTGERPSHYPPSYEPEPTQRPSHWKRFVGVAIALGVVIAKFGAQLKVLLLAITKVKFLTTSASALVSIAAYALIWTWKFAIGFVLLLFIHELGHVLQLRREGIKATAPLFIPFLGAVVGMKELPRDAAAEARVGLAGPILGAAGCLIPLGLWLMTGDELFQALAYVGFFLNLFNLLPVLPLDGGRAMAALSPAIWLVGFAVLVVLTIAYPNPILILVLLAGGYETWRRWRTRRSPEGLRFHEVSPRTRFAVALVYVGLAVALALGMQATYLERSLPS